MQNRTEYEEVTDTMHSFHELCIPECLEETFSGHCCELEREGASEDYHVGLQSRCERALCTKH